MKKIIGIIMAVVSLASCSTPTTLSQQYPGMYEEKPLSIAIMPPINQTTHAEGADQYPRKVHPRRPRPPRLHHSDRRP